VGESSGPGGGAGEAQLSWGGWGGGGGGDLDGLDSRVIFGGGTAGEIFHFFLRGGTQGSFGAGLGARRPRKLIFSSLGAGKKPPRVGLAVPPGVSVYRGRAVEEKLSLWGPGVPPEDYLDYLKGEGKTTPQAPTAGVMGQNPAFFFTPVCTGAQGGPPFPGHFFPGFRRGLRRLHNPGPTGLWFQRGGGRASKQPGAPRVLPGPGRPGGNGIKQAVFSGWGPFHNRPRGGVGRLGPLWFPAPWRGGGAGIPWAGHFPPPKAGPGGDRPRGGPGGMSSLFGGGSPACRGKGRGRLLRGVRGPFQVGSHQRVWGRGGGNRRDGKARVGPTPGPGGRGLGCLPGWGHGWGGGGGGTSWPRGGRATGPVLPPSFTGARSDSGPRDKKKKNSGDVTYVAGGTRQIRRDPSQRGDLHPW